MVHHSGLSALLILFCFDNKMRGSISPPYTKGWILMKMVAL